MLNIAIIEDELPALQKLKTQLSQLCHYQLVYHGEDPARFLADFDHYQIDLVFVDINLPGMNGLQLSQQLQTAGFKGQIIFTTAYSEFAVDAFTLGATDYLLKPYTNERLALALSRVAAQGLPGTEPLMLTSKVGDKVTRIEASQIEVIKLEYGHAIAYSAQHAYPIDLTLEELMTTLPDVFLRIHRNAIVNRLKISTLERWVTGGYLIKLAHSGQQVISSRSGAKLLRQKLQI
ncbi:LytTR family DNA-binding domain-containing protein [Pseudoalteromonas sp. DL2-H2.2]|uniref:LytR/AlgR family response regulator transcription factor n=1 Tax=Pseudoalteromonas sp. DL2-H2.2 TaxID=2908889 RepID=UPI001F39E27C|nr:LytTR family DNA-binding domain-containing protein [Pseudoalteromonas sp. DL2-H2.2]MCF2909647.1 LytTR family DNA-binding domain-containing protein [Pseudoalteromonas sp. DL2-H2.2]